MVVVVWGKIVLIFVQIHELFIRIEKDFFVWFLCFVVMVVKGKFLLRLFGRYFRRNYLFLFFTKNLFFNLLLWLDWMGKKRFYKSLYRLGNVGHWVNEKLANSFWAEIHDCWVFGSVIKIVREEEIFGFLLHKTKHNRQFILLKEELLKQLKIPNDSLVKSLQFLWDLGFLVSFSLKTLVLFQEVILILCAMVWGCL